MFKGFEPVYNKNSKILILGSFPSVKSREVGFYYGNKQNRFWKMLAQIFNDNIEDDISSKLAFLYTHNIALYDVYIESDLNGSADLSLKKSKNKYADLTPLLPPNTNIKCILCNGKASYEAVISSVKIDLPILLLPSTSSANPRFDINVWRKAILDFCNS